MIRKGHQGQFKGRVVSYTTRGIEVQYINMFKQRLNGNKTKLKITTRTKHGD